MSLNDKMTALADAIRSKTGGTEALTLDQMTEDVAGIKLEKPEESLYVVPKYDSDYTYTPEEGKVFNSVEVQGVDTDLLEEWDENFKAENIAKGIWILGREGTAQTVKTCTIVINNPVGANVTYYYNILTDDGITYATTTIDSTAGGTLTNVVCGSCLLISRVYHYFSPSETIEGPINLLYHINTAGANSSYDYYNIAAGPGEQCTITYTTSFPGM